MELNSFAVDKKTEIEGIWKNISKDTRIKVARANNPRYREEFRKKTRPYDEAIRARILDEDTSREIMIEVMALTILISWEGFTDKGKEVKPTLENKIKALTDYPSFRDLVAQIAEDQAHSREKTIQSTEGNSSGVSDGTSKTEKTPNS